MKAREEQDYRLFVVEDHDFMRKILVRVVDSIEGMHVCGQADSAETAIEALREVEADLVLIDVSLPGRNGIDLAEQLRAEYPDLKCVMLSGHGEPAYAEQALSAGARGYILKGKTEELHDGLRHVRHGDVYVSPRVYSGE